MSTNRVALMALKVACTAGAMAEIPAILNRISIVLSWSVPLRLVGLAAFATLALLQSWTLVGLWRAPQLRLRSGVTARGLCATIVAIAVTAPIDISYYAPLVIARVIDFEVPIAPGGATVYGSSAALRERHRFQLASYYWPQDEQKRERFLDTFDVAGPADPSWCASFAESARAYGLAAYPILTQEAARVRARCAYARGDVAAATRYYEAYASSANIDRSMLMAVTFAFQDHADRAIPLIDHDLAHTSEAPHFRAACAHRPRTPQFAKLYGSLCADLRNAGRSLTQS